MTVDPLPAALAGARVEVHKTVAHQLVIDNHSRRTIAVLDEHGVPFIRIGPAGTEGNAAVPAWYLGLNPGAIVPRDVRRQQRSPSWRWVSATPEFGWFDARVDGGQARLGPEVLAGYGSIDVGRWSVPVLVDGEPTSITGRFRYEPPAGAYASRLTSPNELAPGIRVTLLPGQTPGLMLASASNEPVVVDGEDGEPFLRIGPRGVEANLHSPTWWRSGRSANARPMAISATAAPRWTKVAAVPRFSWIDPRATPPLDAEERLKADWVWRVPVRVGGQSMQIAGVRTWRAR